MESKNIQRPKFCPDTTCNCLIKSDPDSQEYEPGHSMFCMGLMDKPLDQDWFGQRHENNIHMCSWFPRGWDKSFINVGDIEIMLRNFLSCWEDFGGRKINPLWILRLSGWNWLADWIWNNGELKDRIQKVMEVIRG